jgi:hypothetical protein
MSKFPRRLWLSAGFLLVLLIATATATAVLSRAKDPPGLQGMLEHYGNLERDHVSAKAKVEYPFTPPVGGKHAGTWQNCGVYRTPIPNETGTHSLEHGAVWIAYGQGISKDDRVKLEKFARGKPYVLLSPVVTISSPISVVAWGVRMNLSRIDLVKLGAFVRAYAPNPDAPEPQFPCVGGTGNPIR